MSENPSEVVGNGANGDGEVQYDNNTVVLGSISIPIWDGGISKKASAVTGGSGIDDGTERRCPYPAV